MISAFHSVGLPDVAILDLIPRVAAAGYRGIELNAELLPWAKPHVTPATDAATRAAIRAACAAHGLAITAVGAHIGEMVDADPAVRAAAVAFVNGCTDLAADLGTGFVHILSGPQAAGARHGESWRWFADAVAATVEHARSRGVEIGIEAIAGHLFCRADDYHALRRDLPGVPFRVNFDPSHLAVQGEDPARVPAELGNLIANVHLKDGSGRYPAFAFPPLGEGTIDFPRLAALLREAGYDGAMAVEYEAQVYGFERTDDAILAEGKAFCDRLGV